MKQCLGCIHSQISMEGGELGSDVKMGRNCQRIKENEKKVERDLELNKIKKGVITIKGGTVLYRSLRVDPDLNKFTILQTSK